MFSSMKGKIVFREEKFGGIIYNSTTGKYNYVTKEQTKEQLEKFKSSSLVFVKNPEITNCYLNAPEEIGLDITQQCNLVCSHCYKDSGKNTKKELSTQEIFEIIDEAAEAGIFCLFISGGEATCRQDLFEIVNYANNKGIRSTLTTNGVYGKDILDKIVSANFLRVQISLDGPKKVHDGIRGKGNFDKSVESIKYLKQRGVDIRISCHLCKINKDFIEEMIALANSIGVAIKFSTIRPIGRQQTTADLEMLTGKEFYNAVQRILELKKDFPKIQITCDFDKLVAEETLYPLPSGGNNRCLAAEKTIAIDSYGNIFPCSFFTPFPEFNAGNVKNNGFMKIWKESGVFKKFRGRKSAEECISCKYFEKSCFGGCPAISYALFNNVEMLDPTCPKSEMKK
ncbi:MAG: radical SAM protein [Candidatus Diapherotrites archaeon]|nr:radical SAM protein [Candidatus Diapherotrites archaeon]